MTMQKRVMAIVYAGVLFVLVPRSHNRVNGVCSACSAESDSRHSYLPIGQQLWLDSNKSSS